MENTMGTSASISKLNDDGSVSSIYCNFDGYLSGVGDILKKFYKTPGYVDKLLSLGDIRGLEESIPLTKANNDRRYDKRTTHYVDWQDYETYGCCEDYNYMYCDGEWTVKPHGYIRFSSLKE